MAGKLAFERYYWFHGRVKEGRYPNARTLAERFEISQKQAQRDVDFIRDRMNAPLVYNYCKRGYEYENSSYEFPPIWCNEHELLALCLALRLSTTLPDKGFKKSLHSVLQKFLTFRSTGLAPSIKLIKEKVSVKNIQYYKVDESVFHMVVSILFGGKPAKILYHSPHKDETTERTILPRHLFCYMGSWHLIAYCTLRGELRDFALSRIRRLELTNVKIDLPVSLPTVKEYIGKNFGIMSGEKSVEVILRFSPQISKWVAEQIWHASQEIAINKDGSMTLRFQVADFREVSREILKYGADVEVLSPVELRQRIKQEIKNMKNLYE